MRKIIVYLIPPVHQPGTYPRFLTGKDVSTIISGGIGVKAQEIFTQNNIEAFMGISSDNPKKLVEHYLNNQLGSGENFGDH